MLEIGCDQGGTVPELIESSEDLRIYAVWKDLAEKTG